MVPTALIVSVSAHGADHLAGQPELPHVREIEEPGPVPNRIVLLEDARVLHGHFETAERHHARAGARVFVVQSGAFGRRRQAGEPDPADFFGFSVG